MGKNKITLNNLRSILGKDIISLIEKELVALDFTGWKNNIKKLNDEYHETYEESYIKAFDGIFYNRGLVLKQRKRKRPIPAWAAINYKYNYREFCGAYGYKSRLFYYKHVPNNHDINKRRVTYKTGEKKGDCQCIIIHVPTQTSTNCHLPLNYWGTHIVGTSSTYNIGGGGTVLYSIENIQKYTCDYTQQTTHDLISLNYHHLDFT